MIDVNHILLFLAIASPLVLLARSWRLRTNSSRAWKIAAAIVLAAACFFWVIAPGSAGFIGGAIWFLFLLVPIISQRKINQLVLQQRFRAACRLAVLVRCLHPSDGSRGQPQFIRAMELWRQGKAAEALSLLAPLRSIESMSRQRATALSFRIMGDRDGFIAWCRQDFRRTSDLVVFGLYLTALGETGALDDLVLQYVAHTQHLGSLTMSDPNYLLNLAVVLAFCGCPGELVRLYSHDLRPVPRDTQEFWLGTAELAAGQIESGTQRLQQLRATTRDASLRSAIDERMKWPSAGRPARLSPASEALLHRVMESHQRRGARLSGRTTGCTTAVWTLIALNTLMFGVEIAFGGTTNEWTLHRLGAMEPYAVLVRGEYWRLFTALFLHYGALHLLFNLYALYVLGPTLERSIGAGRFLTCYLLSGIGSSAGVVCWRLLGWTHADQLVGASGAVMGVIGAWAGSLLRNHHAPLAGIQLRQIVLIVAMQTAFDLATPQVSMAAHLSGLASGILLGFVLAPSRARRV